MFYINLTHSYTTLQINSMLYDIYIDTSIWAGVFYRYRYSYVCLHSPHNVPCMIACKVIFNDSILCVPNFIQLLLFVCFVVVLLGSLRQIGSYC